MLITDHLLRNTVGSSLRNETRSELRFFSDAGKATVFLSHKHDDFDNLNLVVRLLRKLNTTVYVDWMDKTMPKVTSGETAIELKKKIKDLDKFILVASDEAIASKWCNWELGLGDAAKFDKHKIAIFPIQKAGATWTGSEYLEIYPTIVYNNRANLTSWGLSDELIPSGFYYQYKGSDGYYYLIPLDIWLKSDETTYLNKYRLKDGLHNL